jgi:hypothetical protein
MAPGTRSTTFRLDLRMDLHTMPLLSYCRYFRPMEHRDKVDEIRLRMSDGSCSDAIMLANTFDNWIDAKRSGNERAWCDANFVSWKTMKIIAETREHLRGRCVMFNPL